MGYPMKTALAIRDAKTKPKSDRNTKERVLLYLADRKGWVPAIELSQSTTYKFSSRLSELAAQGIGYEKRLQNPRPKGKAYYEYRLKEEK